ncbi:unnamed protein product, partial [Timema podura]|nr:unnamed protein product [Timema podura]
QGLARQAKTTHRSMHFRSYYLLYVKSGQWIACWTGALTLHPFPPFLLIMSDQYTGIFGHLKTSPASPHSGFHQVARMMDSLILDSFSPFTFTKITTTHRPVKTSTVRRSTATQHPQRQHSHRPSPVKPQHPPTHQEVYPATSNTDASRNQKSSNTSPPASDKWVASLRRRDPEIQPALPAINPRRALANYATEAGEKEIPQEDGKMTVTLLQSRTSEQVGSVSEKERS